jgi:hypothetical protein
MQTLGIVTLSVVTLTIGSLRITKIRLTGLIGSIEQTYSIVMLSVILQIAVMPNVFMLNVVAPFFFATGNVLRILKCFNMLI